VLAIPLNTNEAPGTRPIDVLDSIVTYDDDTNCTVFDNTVDRPFLAELEIEWRQPDSKGRRQPPFITLGIESGSVTQSCTAGPHQQNTYNTYNAVMNFFYGGPGDTAPRTNSGLSAIRRWTTNGGQTFAEADIARSGSPIADVHVDEQTHYTLRHTPRAQAHHRPLRRRRPAATPESSSPTTVIWRVAQ
jgi:hypothetical protein